MLRWFVFILIDMAQSPNTFVYIFMLDFTIIARHVHVDFHDWERQIGLLDGIFDCLIDDDMKSDYIFLHLITCFPDNC